jgi:hypothetical protein
MCPLLGKVRVRYLEIRINHNSHHVNLSVRSNRYVVLWSWDGQSKRVLIYFFLSTQENVKCDWRNTIHKFTLSDSLAIKKYNRHKNLWNPHWALVDHSHCRRVFYCLRSKFMFNLYECGNDVVNCDEKNLFFFLFLSQLPAVSTASCGTWKSANRRAVRSPALLTSWPQAWESESGRGTLEKSVANARASSRCLTSSGISSSATSTRSSNVLWLPTTISMTSVIVPRWNVRIHVRISRRRSAFHNLEP